MGRRRAVTLARARSPDPPPGGGLPAEAWERRHRALRWLLFGGGDVVAVHAIADGRSAGYVALHAGAIAALALVAGATRLGRRGRSLAGSLGLLTAGAVGVHVSGSVVEAAAFVAAGGVAGAIVWVRHPDARGRTSARPDPEPSLATIDGLTGLRNRRRLLEDLESAFDRPPALLATFALDGLEAYIDTFGRAAGDALLARLARRLESVLDGTGATSYRVDGGAFCVLAAGPDGSGVVRAASLALSEAGEVPVSSSHGAVDLGSEAATPEAALRIAGERMRANMGTAFVATVSAIAPPAPAPASRPASPARPI